MNLKEEFDFLSQFRWKKSPDVSWRPWRDVKEIIDSGFFCSCSEAARVFFKRASDQGVKARFIAMMDVKKSTRNSINNHCYVELLLGNKWFKVDPTQRKVIESYPEGWIFVTDKEKWSSFSAFVDCHKALL